MIIKCYKPLSNWLSWVVLILTMGISPIIQAATDCNAVTGISKGECESLLEVYMNPDKWQDLHGSGRDAKIVDYELFQPQQELETAFNTGKNNAIQ